jgi:hypothetical protein
VLSYGVFLSFSFLILFFFFFLSKYNKREVYRWILPTIDYGVFLGCVSVWFPALGFWGVIWVLLWCSFCFGVLSPVARGCLRGDVGCFLVGVILFCGS